MRRQFFRTTTVEQNTCNFLINAIDHAGMKLLFIYTKNVKRSTIKLKWSTINNFFMWLVINCRRLKHGKFVMMLLKSVAFYSSFISKCSNAFKMRWKCLWVHIKFHWKFQWRKLVHISPAFDFKRYQACCFWNTV